MANVEYFGYLKSTKFEIYTKSLYFPNEDQGWDSIVTPSVSFTMNPDRYGDYPVGFAYYLVHTPVVGSPAPAIPVTSNPNEVGNWNFEIGYADVLGQRFDTGSTVNGWVRVTFFRPA